VKKLRDLITFRTAALLAAFAALIALGAYLNRAGYLDSDAVSALIGGLGHWAIPAYIALFIVGGLLQVPGVLFVIAAHFAFGPLVGFAAAYVGAILAVTVSFSLVRALRGRDAEPARLPFAWAQRILDRAESRPILSVVILRLVFFLSPPLNVGLGFSKLRTRDYVVGSAIGLAAPLGVVICTAGLI
jgi:uncharacterized membrane protein YdjX (TVP38/TMEM64 family)